MKMSQNSPYFKRKKEDKIEEQNSLEDNNYIYCQSMIDTEK